MPPASAASPAPAGAGGAPAPVGVARAVTTWALEQRDPSQLRPARPVPAEIRTVGVPVPAFSRFLYTAVGGEWWWTDRLGWTAADWERHLAGDVETLVAWVDGTPAGYAELQDHADGSVEVALFGLLAQFRGRGLGGHLLTVVTARCWRRTDSRVWLTTCSLDAPHARATYEARGYRVVGERTEVKELPAEPPGPWPGAGRPG